MTFSHTNLASVFHPLGVWSYQDNNTSWEHSLSELILIYSNERNKPEWKVSNEWYFCIWFILSKINIENSSASKTTFKQYVATF